MPFGPTNGLATFITFAYDICSIWQEEAKRRRVPICDNYNTCIIVDYIFHWCAPLMPSLLYSVSLIECQSIICCCASRRCKFSHHVLNSWVLVLLLVEICPPNWSIYSLSQSQNLLMFRMWLGSLAMANSMHNLFPISSFGFLHLAVLLVMIIHSQLAICGHRCPRPNLTTPIKLYWMIHVSTKLVILLTEFSSFGFGWCLLQPGDDAASVPTAQDYRDGKSFSFMTKASQAIVHSVCFGARRTLGNESRLHSHLSEGFSGDYDINKCRQYLFAQRFLGYRLLRCQIYLVLWRLEPCYPSIADAAYVLGCWYCLSTRHWTCRFRLLIPYRSRSWVWPSLCSVLKADSAASITVPMLPNITKVCRFNLLQMQLPLRLRMSRHCWRLLSLLRLSVLTHCVFMPIQLVRLPMLQSLT